MLQIPYEKQIDDRACALACYTMVAKYFFPEVTSEEMKKIADWQPNYVVWAFKFWKWIMDRGIKIEEYELIDYKLWAEKGTEGLRKSVSDNEFNFYIKNAKDITVYPEQIKEVIKHKNFLHHREKPTYEQLTNALAENKVCAVVLDSRSLRGLTGFSLHQVVVLDANKDYVYLHDPLVGPKFTVSKKTFVNAWLTVVAQPELTIYSK